MYHEDKVYPEDKAKLGRYLGPTEPGIGSVMNYYVLQSTGEVGTKRTIIKLTPQEQEDRTMLKEQQAFDNRVIQSWAIRRWIKTLLLSKQVVGSKSAMP
jgi:hypothetical protein